MATDYIHKVMTKCDAACQNLTQLTDRWDPQFAYIGCFLAAWFFFNVLEFNFKYSCLPLNSTHCNALSVGQTVHTL